MDLRIPIHAEPRLPGRLDRPGTAEPVDSFEAADGRDVILCGGEPTLREDLPDLVRRVRRAGAAHITLETDGVALAIPGVPGALAAAGVDRVRIPFPSARPDAHDWLADRAGTAARRTRAIRACLEADLPVEADIALTRSTTAHLPETISVLQALGVRLFVVRRPEVSGRLDASSYLALGPRADDLRAALDAARRLAPELRTEGLDELEDEPVFGSSPAVPATAADGVVRVSWSPEEPTREVRRRLVRTMRGRTETFRVAGPEVFEHPAAFELLRDAARLGVEAVEVAEGTSVPDWTAPRRRRLPPFVEAATDRRTAMLERERIANRSKHWVRLVTACNSRCLFCLDSDTPRNLYLPVDEIRAELRRGRESLGADKAILSGGEGSLHPEFTDIVRYARSVGYTRVQTVTNGWRWADRDFFEDAVDAGLDELTFSLHGHTEELHDHLTQHPGSFQRIVKAILRSVRARDRGVITNVDVVINKQNVAVIDKIVEFAIRLGVTEFDLLHVIPQAAAYTHRADLFYDPSEHLDVLHKVFRLNRHPGFVVWTNRFPVAWLEGLEDLIQDPHKMLDEVHGRRFQLRAQLDSGTPLSCREPDRCRHCFIEPFCTATDRVADRTRDAQWEVFDVADGESPDELPFGAHLLGTRGHRQTHHPTWVRDAPPEPPPDGFDGVLVAHTAEQVQAWLRLEVELDVELNRVTASALLADRAQLAGALDRVRIHQPGRSSLDAAARHDVRDPASFFAELDLPVRVSGLPSCALAEARPVSPRPVLSASRFDPGTGRLDTRSLAQRHVEETYFGKSIRCRECSVTDLCEGLPIQMVRDQGLQLARPLASPPTHPPPAPGPRLATGKPHPGTVPGLPGFGLAVPAEDPLRRLSADKAEQRRRRRLEVLG